MADCTARRRGYDGGRLDTAAVKPTGKRLARSATRPTDDSRPARRRDVDSPTDRLNTITPSDTGFRARCGQRISHNFRIDIIGSLSKIILGLGVAGSRAASIQPSPGVWTRSLRLAIVSDRRFASGKDGARSSTRSDTADTRLPHPNPGSVAGERLVRTPGHRSRGALDSLAFSWVAVLMTDEGKPTWHGPSVRLAAGSR